DAIDALKTIFDSDLTAAFVAIETARSCTITRPKVIARYDDTGRRYPKIELVPGDMDIQYGDPDTPLVEGIGFPSVDAFVSVAGTDFEALGDELSRYFEAIYNVIIADNTLGGEVDWAYPETVEWGDFAVALEDKRIVKSLRIGIQMKKHG
ncbi:MAG: hypothetical protein U9R15_09115, partial [Chloroflexota bacterium]|nr:hypothetical protein [Chloroflexota bacterium]